MSQEFASPTHNPPASLPPVNLRVPPPISKDQALLSGVSQEIEHSFDGGAVVRRRLADGGITQRPLKPLESTVERRLPELVKQPSKLLAPIELRPNHVSRHRLLEKLKLDCALTQIVAPAGYGKSTLVAEWLAQSKRSHVWLALEQSDNSPIYFGKRFLQALSQLFSSIGFHFFSTMACTTPRALQRSVAELWDELNVLTNHHKMVEPAVLVIDNYQVIHESWIHTCLSEILKQLPSHVHVILISRCEPPLNKDCLQFLTQKTLGYSDLAFTNQETAELLKKSSCRPQNLFNSWEVSELLMGWVAGLHLILEQSAALKNSVEELLFLKNSNLVASHFMIETFYSAHPTVQLFMLCTSLLNQFTADLCDSLFAGDLHSVIFYNGAVADEHLNDSCTLIETQTACAKEIQPQPATLQQNKFENSQQMIEHLKKSGQFIMRCTNRKGWYQYHPLFARMLRSELQKNYRDLELALRDRSQIWYLRQDGKMSPKSSVISPKSG